MDERENLPAVIPAQKVAVSTTQHGSLAGRGLVALRKNNDAHYRQTREVYNRLTDYGLGQWVGYEEREIPLTETLNSFKLLAASGYGKAYFPLSALYSGHQSIEGDSTKAERYRKLALGWLHANQHLNDPEIWHDLGALYIGEKTELAVNWFQKAADVGHASSMWMLSGAYETGESVEQDWGKSLYWQIKAAEAGHVEAQHGLEMQHEHGDLKSKIDDEQVFNWYVWSAEHGYVWAQLFLAETYFHGEGVHQDAEEAVHWYIQAANQGEHHAQLQLGKMFWEGRLDGREVKPDAAQAKHWLEKAAVQADPESQYELGLFLYEQAEQGEEELAVQWIQSAADQGYGPAQCLIVRDAGTTFDVTDAQCGELLDSAFRWYEERVESGDTELLYDYALIHLDNLANSHSELFQADRFEGLRLLKGVADPTYLDFETGRALATTIQGRASRRIGIELLKFFPTSEDVADAIHWLEQADDLGDNQACEDLAHLYSCGHLGVIHRLESQTKLVEIDLQVADYWVGRAVQLGQGRAVYHLGRMLLEGEHLSQNLALAEKWLLQAANVGYDSAQIQLGAEYESGKRFGKNNELAMHWYKKAVEKGRWPAMYRLAHMLEIGSDFEQAISLYKQAACYGHEKSQQRLNELGINWKT